MFAMRDFTIQKFKDSITSADFLVFTMGLTESWFDSAGFEYPMCPGTVAGEFDASRHSFYNQDYDFILNKMRESLDAAKQLNNKLRFILTVSPVPLTATKSGNHVLVATMESKSILRAVAGKLAKERADVDYFPSYEIINSPSFAGVFFEPNKRSVHPSGVKFVMDTFFKSINSSQPEVTPAELLKESSLTANKNNVVTDMDAGCEEAMLDAYSRKNL